VDFSKKFVEKSGADLNILINLPGEGKRKIGKKNERKTRLQSTRIVQIA